MSTRTFMKRIGGAVSSTIKNLQKRAGLSIYRPVMNAQKWADWLKESGVPNAKSAADLKVNVLQAIGGVVAVIPDRDVLNIRSTSGVFMNHGVNGLAFAWYDYYYNDRHWTLRELAGCEVSCVHRNLLVLSDDIGDFELTDDMLVKAPPSITLDGEQTATIADGDVDLVKSAAGVKLFKAKEPETANALLINTYDEAGPDPILQGALYDLSKGRAVDPADLDSLDEADKKVLGLVQDVPERELEGTPVAKTAPVAKPAPIEGEVIQKSERKSHEAALVKRSPSLQTAYGWASVATSPEDGVQTDHHGHEITTDAQRDLLWGLVRGQRQGNIDHDEEDMSAELVEGIVFTKELWSALKPFEGQEGLFIGMHVPDKENWDKTEGLDMFSIGCRGTVEEIDVPDEEN